MQTQKDKVAVDISQIPQDALKSYDNWRFGKNLFIGLSATFIVLLFSFLIDPLHPSSPFLFAVAFGMSAALILFSLSSPRRKRYSVFLFSDEGKAFTLICTETIALFFIAASLYALFLDAAFSTPTTVQAIFITIIMLPIAIIAHNANDEFAADETVYLPQRVLKSQEKISELVVDKTTNGQNLSQAQTQDAQAKAAKFEPKIDDASRQDELVQSDEDAEALEYGKALVQIPKNLKYRYQLHRLVRFNFPTFTALAYCLTLNYLGMDNLYLVVLSAIVCTLLFLILKRKYSNLFIKNPEKSNTIFAVENFATFALIFYLPITKSQHNDGAIGAFGVFLLLTPILIIVIAACIYRNQSVYEELKE